MDYTILLNLRNTCSFQNRSK